MLASAPLALEVCLSSTIHENGDATCYARVVRDVHRDVNNWGATHSRLYLLSRRVCESMMLASAPLALEVCLSSTIHENGNATCYARVVRDST